MSADPSCGYRLAVVLMMLRIEAPAQGGLVREIRVLVAVRPKGLLRAVEAVLRESPGVRVVGRLVDGRRLAHRTAQLDPDVVVAGVRALGRQQAAVVAAIRRGSPGTKLVLIHPFAVGRGSGAEAYVEEPAVFERLVPCIERLWAEADPGRHSH
ncbi:MAG: response regulator transcription factor [Acidobacteria bacterium]|nr:response regulator transcription factor [Acidobacteriota bacterium]